MGSGQTIAWPSAARALVIAVVIVLFTTPLVWMVSASLRPVGLPLPTRFEPWPPEPSLESYPAIFGLLPLGRYAFNSVIVAATAVPLTLLTASWAGFAMTQLAPRRRDLLIGLSVMALLVPPMALWLTRFLVFKWLGVLDTLLALILPAILGGGPFYVLLMHWAFRRVPAELFDAARVDGAGALRIWWSIGLPLVQPALLAVGALAFVVYWNDFISPLLYLTSQERYTLPLAVQALQQMHPSRWSLLMAGAVVVTFPAMLAFLVAQRFFLQEPRGGGWLGR